MAAITAGAKERMNEIYKITSMLTRSQFNDFEEILKIACGFLEIESALISNVKDSQFTILSHFSFNQPQENLKDKVFDIKETFSAVVIAQKKIIVVDNASYGEYSNHSFFETNNIKVYLGTPIWMDGEISGSLSFYSRTLRAEAFSQDDIDFVQYLGQWISNFLHKSFYEKQIAEKNEQLEKLNAELEKNNEQLSNNIQEKEHLSQILVHDLKSPLSNIQMLTFLFEELAVGKESEELLVIFNKSLQDIFHLISQMETLNEVDNTALKPYLEEVDVNALIEEQISFFSRTAEVKNIQLQFFPSAEDRKISSDINILKRVISNLISNAIKFSDFNKAIKIHVVNTENHIRVSICDEGPGIREDEQHRLFKRFSKLSNKPTNKESSSGLGLYIVKELLEKLNSTIELQSTFGEGSTFTINLPANSS